MAVPDYYEILQVSPNADEEVIQAAYRKLASKWHPDKRPGDPLAEERMRELNEARDVLSRKSSREQYDEERKQRQYSAQSTIGRATAVDGETESGGTKGAIEPCPACGQKVRFPDDAGDLRLICPACRHSWEWVVPELATIEVPTKRVRVGNVSAADVGRAQDDACAQREALQQVEGEYRSSKRRLQYAQLIQRFRILASSVEGRPNLALIVATAFFGLTAPLLVGCGFGLLGVLTGATIGFLVGGGASVFFLYYPADSFVANSLADLPQELRRKADDMERLRRLVRDASERSEQLRRVVESRRNRLLHTPWRALTGIPFERFLAEVFAQLGYTVETTKASGDQGVDLVLFRDTARIAVQAKGHAGSVGNSAVQQVYTGMRIYGCNGCVVVTNSYFTLGARQAAAMTGCLLIEGDRIPDLILGKVL